MALLDLNAIEHTPHGLRFDISGVGAAVVEIPRDVLNIDTLNDIQVEIERRIFDSLPKAEYAVSVILPIYNEATVLEALVREFVEAFGDLPFRTELLLCENGSMDGTDAVAQTLVNTHENLRLLSIHEPSYGRAIRHGIEEAHADILIIFNADLWSRRFLLDSILLLQSGYDIVVGSKRLGHSRDDRPFIRRAITAGFNFFLKCVFRFRGTDTHGMKALRRSKVLPVMSRCYTNREVFDTELVLKAERDGLNVCEVPVTVRDTRPARLSLLKRVPSTVRDLISIARSL